jgi:hypothetical protein
MKVIAKKINNPNCDYLTEGKVYSVLPATANFDKKGFLIVDGTDAEIFCPFKNCPHINGNWTIITDKAKVR